MTLYTPGTRVACPCCGKGVKVTSKGSLARHGHQFPAVGSYRFGTICKATGTKTVADGLRARREVLEAELTEAEEQIRAGRQVGWYEGRIKNIRVEMGAIEARLV